jgi:hypothetical protein
MPALRSRRTRKSRPITNPLNAELNRRRQMAKEIPSIASIRQDSAQLTAMNIPIGRSEASSESPSSLNSALTVSDAMAKDFHQHIEHNVTSASALTFQSLPMPILDTITVAGITTSPSSYVSLAAIETLNRSADIRNQAAIAEALTKANHMLGSNRAENTKKAYAPKKNLWTTWCQSRDFSDGATVTEGKLCLWLQEEVLVNGSQARGGQNGSMLSRQGVEGYIKPIIDLYRV